MSAELLRRAAARIRELAGPATSGPWRAEVLGSEGYAVREVEGKPRPGSRIPRPVRVARCGYEDWDTDRANAEHIASWHPAVALAVADWLDRDAEGWEQLEALGIPDMDSFTAALAVARTYLGEES